MQHVSLSIAVNDFRQARRRARMQELLGRLTDTSFELLAYDDVRRKLRARGAIERGVREIPLDAIIGSVGRYTDFTRTFLPLHDSTEERWASVKAAQIAKGLPPITVYQIDKAYFVQDGHHRVSIARASGSTMIEARVIEVQTAVPLTPDVRPDDLILKAEYADFLAQTGLDKLFPEADFAVTSIGQHLRLLEHIEVHHYYMGLDQKRDIPFAEAVRQWYLTIYQPVVQVIRERGLLREFPKRTETDLYLWLAKHRAEIEAEVGWAVPSAAAVTDLVERFGSYRPAPILRRVLSAVGLQSKPPAGQSWWRERAGGFGAEALFANILLPLDNRQPDWGPLAAAVQWARRESSQIIGLYAVKDNAARTGIAAQAIQAEFERRLDAANVPTHFKIEKGSIPHLLQEHARWVDLTVLPLSKKDKKAAGARTLAQISGLTLLLPKETEGINRPALLYDGLPGADELLFLAAYLCESWGTSLTVLHPGGTELEAADAYLRSNAISANFVIVETITADALAEAVVESGSDVLLLGAFNNAIDGRDQVKQIVADLVRLAQIPLLVYG